MSNPLTQGTHHIGLTVSKLEETGAFFTAVLGWEEVRRDAEYPAIFVSDNKIMVTLWATKVISPVEFNRKANVGLHHIAFHVGTENELNKLYERLISNSVDIEFAPKVMKQGPAKHLMCYEPSGIRVEFIWPGELV